MNEEQKMQTIRLILFISYLMICTGVSIYDWALGVIVSVLIMIIVVLSYIGQNQK